MMSAHSPRAWSSGAFSPGLAPLAPDDTHSQLCFLVRGPPDCSHYRQLVTLLGVTAFPNHLWQPQHALQPRNPISNASALLTTTPEPTAALCEMHYPSSRATSTTQCSHSRSGWGRRGCWPLDSQLSLHEGADHPTSWRCFASVALLCQGFTTGNWQQMGLF